MGDHSRILGIVKSVVYNFLLIAGELHSICDGLLNDLISLSLSETIYTNLIIHNCAKCRLRRTVIMDVVLHVAE